MSRMRVAAAAPSATGSGRCPRGILAGTGWILLGCSLGTPQTAGIRLVGHRHPFPTVPGPVVPAAAAGEPRAQDWLPGQRKYDKYITLQSEWFTGQRGRCCFIFPPN